MFSFSHILPYTDEIFFAFFALIICFMLLGKFALSKILPYRIALALSSLAYLLLLFPKPLQFLGLSLYFYLMFVLLTRILKVKSLLIAVFVLTIPLLLMKIMNVIPGDKEHESVIESIFIVSGLSFLSFKVIQIFLDERLSEKRISLLDFFNFTAFTPTILIGPLDRFNRFQQNISLGYENINLDRMSKGFNYFLKGLLFKFILAEAIQTLIINHLKEDGSVFFHFAYMYSYYIHLFFDFAGYSLLAMSFGAFIGIDVPLNFNKPFLAENPKMFWQHWHKSLGDWLNDYFFKPVFKDLTTRKVFTSIRRQNIALFLTFTAMGFWNGFELHFIVSGMLFGFYSVVHNTYVYQCKKNKRELIFGNLSAFWIRAISIFIMFQSTAFAIYIFSGKLF